MWPIVASVFPIKKLFDASAKLFQNPRKAGETQPLTDGGINRLIAQMVHLVEKL